MMQTFTQNDTPTAAPTTMGVKTRSLLATSGKRLNQQQRTSRPRHQRQGEFITTVDKEAIREALPFARLLEHYDVEMLANEQVRCPFHGEDRRPSATIRNDFFYCYTCNASHDLFGFIMAMEQCGFPEALRIAANIAGIAYPEQGSASRHQLALVVQARKHDMAERQRITLSSEQKYWLLATVARTVRQDAPEWLAKLDSLLDDWLHGVPDDVDLRVLLSLVQGKHFDAMGPIIICLDAEQKWVNHA